MDSKLLIILFLFLVSCQSEKIGYVESGQLLIQYSKTKEAALEIEKNTAILRARFDTLRSELESLETNYPKLISNKSQVEITELQNSIKRKRQEVNQYYQVMSEKIKEEDDKATKIILAEINEIVQEYGKQNGYAYILGATSTGNIAYANSNQNLTDEIIKILNSN